MGLDIGCDCGRISFRAGSYSGFGAFRRFIALNLGISPRTLKLFHGSEIETYAFDEVLPLTPFFELLTHSDCDGKLSSQECSELLQDFENHHDKFKRICFPEEIEEIANAIKNIRGGNFYYWEKYLEWLEAVKHCAEEDCELHFR